MLQGFLLNFLLEFLSVILSRIPFKISFRTSIDKWWTSLANLSNLIKTPNFSWIASQMIREFLWKFPLENPSETSTRTFVEKLAQKLLQRLFQKSIRFFQEIIQGLLQKTKISKFFHKIFLEFLFSNSFWDFYWWAEISFEIISICPRKHFWNLLWIPSKNIPKFTKVSVRNSSVVSSEILPGTLYGFSPDLDIPLIIIA